MAFFDGQGKTSDRERLGTHLRGCEDCQAVFEEIGNMVMFGDGALDLVHPAARVARRSRTRWLMPVAAAAVVVLGIGIGTQQAGQRIMAAIGTLFQVKSIGTVPVTPEQIAAITKTVTQGGKVSLAHYGSVTVAGPMKVAPVPASQLSSQGMPDLWPKGLGPVTTAMVDSGIRVTLKLNVPHINELIASEGGHDLFPASLNQEPFTLVVPAAATMRSGNWTVEEVPQPTLAVPGTVPVKAVTKALENLPFLPPSLQSAVAQMADWKNTLIVPLPGHPQNVAVAGTNGIVAENRLGTTAGEAWVQNGLVVAVMEHQSHKISQSAFQTEVGHLFP